MTDNLNFIFADGLEYFAPHLDAWDQLMERVAMAMPMASAAWQVNHFRYRLAEDSHPRGLFVYKSDQLIAVLPFIAHDKNKGTGSGEYFHTPHSCVDLLTEPGWEDELAGQLLKQFRNHLPQLKYLNMKFIPVESPAISIYFRKKDGWLRANEKSGLCSYLDVTGSAEGYFKALSHNFSRNLYRYAKRLDDLSDVKFGTLNGDEARPDFISKFIELEGSGWKGQSGTAIKSIPDLKIFFENLVEWLYKRRWLEWHFLEAEGKIIAAHLATCYNKTVFLTKICYDEEYARCGPGNLLMEFAIRRCFNDPGIEKVNFLTYFDWHNNWRVKTFPYYHLHIYPRTFLNYWSGYLPAVTRIRSVEMPILRNIYKLWKKTATSSGILTQRRPNE